MDNPAARRPKPASTRAGRPATQRLRQDAQRQPSIQTVDGHPLGQQKPAQEQEDHRVAKRGEGGLDRDHTQHDGERRPKYRGDRQGDGLAHPPDHHPRQHRRQARRGHRKTRNGEDQQGEGGEGTGPEPERPPRSFKPLLHVRHLGVRSELRRAVTGHAFLLLKATRGSVAATRVRGELSEHAIRSRRQKKHGAPGVAPSRSGCSRAVDRCLECQRRWRVAFGHAGVVPGHSLRAIPA